MSRLVAWLVVKFLGLFGFRLVDPEEGIDMVEDMFRFWLDDV